MPDHSIRLAALSVLAATVVALAPPHARATQKFGPVQTELQTPAPHWSSCTGIPVDGSPGCALHGLAPWRLLVPVVRGRVMLSVPANCECAASVGQSLETG